MFFFCIHFLILFFFCFFFYLLLAEKLKEDYETTLDLVNQRKSELDTMLEDSRSFDQNYADFEAWQSHFETELDVVERQAPEETTMQKHEVIIFISAF